MGINIKHTLNNFQFESRENLRNAAKDILNKQNASQESIQRILDKTIFDSDNGRIYSNSQLAILKASSQISMSGKFKETLKYLKNNPSKKSEKTPVLGELWNIFSKEELSYDEEFDKIEIDYTVENIFAAA